MGIEGDVVSCLYENAVVSFFQFFRVIHPFPLFTCYVTRLLFFSFLLLYHPFLFIFPLPYVSLLLMEPQHQSFIHSLLLPLLPLPINWESKNCLSKESSAVKCPFLRIPFPCISRYFPTCWCSS